MRQIVLDTETTGLHVEQGHRIIEIGCVELINRKATGRHYHQYINPLRAIDEEAVAVHGITDQFLQDKPVFSTIRDQFMEFVKDAELIIHNAPFDVGFINSELKQADLASPITDYCRILDTLTLAKQLHVGQRNSLDALCKRYEIDNSHREFHGALLDAHLLAKVYLAMTGGQGSLFDEISIGETPIQKVTPISFQSIQQQNLPIIKANDMELAEHQKYISAMAKKGKCLWVEDK